MKVLVTNNHLGGLGGSETATWTIARALRARGHEVCVATRHFGRVSDRLKAEGFDVAQIPDFHGREFDVIHCHHNSMAGIVRLFFRKTPMLYYGHGVVPALEAPPGPAARVTLHAAVSEEVAAFWRDKHGVEDVRVVRNAVDVQRFRPASEIALAPRRVLVISHQHRLVVQAAGLLGGGVRHEVGFIGGRDPVWNVEDHINRADLVCTVGRGVLEAMACGRAACVLNQVLGDGMVTQESYYHFRESNFSGRCLKRRYTAEELAREIAGNYSAFQGTLNREYVLAYHNAETQAARLEELYREAMGNA